MAFCHGRSPYFGSYKTTPTPTYRSGVKKITLFTPEGKTCTGTFLEIEGRTGAFCHGQSPY